ncbi:MAG TPA: hypothetical protein VNU01_04600 [Egibacteraceae bacterium]|nr:hypothetical protein [Egibacteraceae bacterium]
MSIRRDLAVALLLLLLAALGAVPARAALEAPAAAAGRWGCVALDGVAGFCVSSPVESSGL